MSTRLRARLNTTLLGVALLLPSLVFLALFTGWPLAQTLVNSLYKQNLATRGEPRFVGLQQFVDLFTDPTFLKVMANTLVFTLITVSISIVLAFLFATLLNQKLRVMGLFRTGIFYPTILPMVSAATVWLLMYNDDFGLVNDAIRFFGGKPLNFLGTPELALPALAAITIWKQAGYLMVFYLAGLQGLPTDVVEAGKLDGASAWQTLRYITLPMLRGTTIFVLTIAVTASFQTVDQVYVMTQGGPNNASNLLLYNIYETAFRFQNTGLAYAMTVVLLAVLLIFTVLNSVVADRKSYDAD
jgi:sn-glycerol 3-phosphate transport system permease protein